MKSTEKVRVIMITFNGHQYIKAQIDSILSQKRLESIHIYDDASEPSFVSILKSLEKDKPDKIFLHLNQVNLGVNGNIKKALSEHLDAEYIALSDQDDIWLPEKLDITYEALKKIEISKDVPALVYHDMSIIDEQDNLLTDSFWQISRQAFFRHSLNTNMILNHVTGAASLINGAMARYAKDIPEHLNIYHDAWIGMIGFTFGRAQSLPLSLIQHRKHENSLTFHSDMKQSIWSRFMRNLKLILKIDKQFEAQFKFLQSFYNCYEKGFNPKVKNELNSFLKLQSASYFTQKKYIWRYIKPNIQ